jgi:hypothetical protein
VRRTAGGSLGDEAGVVLVLVAIAVLALFGTVALVLDLGQLRTDRRTNKGVADMAAAAGVGRLPFGPWSGVCKARDYLLGNLTGVSSFDPGSETWSDAATPSAPRTSSPCPATATGPDSVPCSPNAPETWARLRATAGGARFGVEIQSGYVLPDPRFSDDTSREDTGGADQGSCDNLAVILTERRAPSFAQLVGAGATTTRARSVGRLNATETVNYTAALQLLERNLCNVLQTGGTNTRVYAQPYQDQPGIIQIDSADDAGSCPSPILNAQETSVGPSVVACSVNSTLIGCRPGTGTRASRIGIYALNFVRPVGDIATPYPATYGDTKAVATTRSGRRFADKRYRENVAALDAEAESVLTGNSGRPPGCSSVTNNACTSSTDGRSWLVLSATDCSNVSTFFAVPGRAGAQNVWFNCDLDVTSDLTLSGADSYVVVTGSLSVKKTFTIDDPRRFYVGGRSTGNTVGLADGSPGSALRVNLGGAASCAERANPKATRMVVGNGSLKVSSGAATRLCHTFVYLASGYGRVPGTDGTNPCSSPCSTYNGVIEVTSGASIRWTAPNQIIGRLPTPTDLAYDSNPFEDLALWSEAGGNTHGITGGGESGLTGVFFLPNADSFSLAGGSGQTIDLSAQFISRTLKITGGATINLVPTPTDAIPVVIYSTLLVR